MRRSVFGGGVPSVKDSFAEEINSLTIAHHGVNSGVTKVGGYAFWHSILCAAYFSYFAIYGRCLRVFHYRFSELLESHAVNTYVEFLDENEAFSRSYHLRSPPCSITRLDHLTLSTPSSRQQPLAQGQEVRSFVGISGWRAPTQALTPRVSLA
jgi:hypothetical protein